jgi:hypothetical protein
MCNRCTGNNMSLNTAPGCENSVTSRASAVRCRGYETKRSELHYVILMPTDARRFI